MDKAQRNNELFIREANAFFNRYYELTGKDFPACNQTDWISLDAWLADLKVAVYAEEARKAIEADTGLVSVASCCQNRFAWKIAE